MARNDMMCQDTNFMKQRNKRVPEINNFETHTMAFLWRRCYFKSFFN